MRLIFALVVVVLAGCVSPGISQNQTAGTKQCENRVESLFPSREGVRVKRAEMLRECARSAFGHQPAVEEYYAYFIYVASEIDARRMTAEQGQYLITQKKNELLERDSRVVQQQQQQQPPPTYNTNCSTTLDGYNCTTTPSGGRYGDPSGPRYGY